MEEEDFFFFPLLFALVWGREDRIYLKISLSVSRLLLQVIGENLVFCLEFSNLF